MTKAQKMLTAGTLLVSLPVCAQFPGMPGTVVFDPWALAEAITQTGKLIVQINHAVETLRMVTTFASSCVLGPLDSVFGTSLPF